MPSTPRYVYFKMLDFLPSKSAPPKSIIVNVNILGRTQTPKVVWVDGAKLDRGQKTSMSAGKQYSSNRVIVKYSNTTLPYMLG